MWINKDKYFELISEVRALEIRNTELEKEVKELKDDSGEAMVNKLTALAKKCQLDVHSDEYQTMMHRVFMDIGGRQSPVLKVYSKTSFLKDTPEELMERLAKLTQDASIITKKLESKTKK